MIAEKKAVCGLLLGVGGVPFGGRNIFGTVKTDDLILFHSKCCRSVSLDLVID